MPEMNRREFVGAAAALCAACVLCPSSISFGAAQAGEVDVGALADFAKDGIKDQFAGKGHFLLIRKDGRLYALSTMCTHKQAPAVGIDKSNASGLRCSKHGSLFAMDGTVTKGPAKRPLSRYAIHVNSGKHVIVDPARQFEEKDWANPEAFVKIEN